MDVTQGLGNLVIPAAIGVLLTGTIAFVVSLTAAARAVDRLIDAVLSVRAGRRATSPSRPGTTRVRRIVRARVPLPVLVAVVAAGLVFALAWASFVLTKVAPLG